METKGFKVPAWFIGVIGMVLVTSGGVSWAYGTFVTIRERDLVRSLFEQRLAGIEAGQRIIEEKVDRLLERTEK